MTQPDDDLPEEIAASMMEAGFAPTLSKLKELIARAHEHEAALQWPMLWLVPPHIHEELVRRAAVQGLLRAEHVGTRWFCTVNQMETWLRRTGRWFYSTAEERRWRERVSSSAAIVRHGRSRMRRRHFRFIVGSVL